MSFSVNPKPETRMHFAAKPSPGFTLPPTWQPVFSAAIRRMRGLAPLRSSLLLAS